MEVSQPSHTARPGGLALIISPCSVRRQRAASATLRVRSGRLCQLSRAVQCLSGGLSPQGALPSLRALGAGMLAGQVEAGFGCAMRAQRRAARPNQSLKLTGNSTSRWSSSAGASPHFALAAHRAVPSPAA